MLMYPGIIQDNEDGIYLVLEDAKNVPDKVSKERINLSLLCLFNGTIYTDSVLNIKMHPQIEVWRIQTQ
jgi:hypothetical protein